MEIEVEGWLDITLGNTMKVVLADFNINETVGIISVDYIFDKNRSQAESVIKIKLSKKILDITDEINDLRSRLESLESQDRQDTDVLTRLQTATGSASVVGSFWEVKTRTLGSSFVLGHPGTNPGGDQAGGRLGSIIASGVNFLGDNRSALGVVASGGFF